MRVSGAKDVIDEIRRTEFLLDVELSPDAQIGARNVRAKLHRALHLLSEELYSRETHFVLELIQNADDNHYSALEIPEVSFELSSNRLEITNNEAGFSAENVRALCDVGSSTKAKRDGFIGEKGIGFKSVFAVSDRPEIHSNDFHFRFDTTIGDLLGYVVPIWLDDCERQAGTRIVLPAKLNHTFTSATLSELSEQLLLFLRNLRRLKVRDAISQSAFIAERMDQGHRLTLTSTSHSLSNEAQSPIAATYLRVEHSVLTGDLHEGKRPDISETQLILAFPLNDDGTARAESTHPVFAYLPVRDVGFRFVLQADFLLSSSREDIHKNSPWNIRLRDAVAEAFVSAVPHFKSAEQLARTFLHYVPEDFDIVDDFFRETVEHIKARLSETACVQSRSGRWCIPAQILLTDTDFQALFSNEDLQRCLQLEYPMQTFTHAARQILGRLGAPSAALSHTLRLLQDEGTLAHHSAEWFSALYEYLARSYPGEQSLKRLRPLACIWVADGALKSASKDEIFFPLSRGKRYGFEQDLDIVDKEVFAGAADRAARVREFLGKLGVHEASPYTLIENHILPQHAADEWETSKLETLAGHVAYIKDYLPNYIQGHIANGFGSTASSAAARLREGLYIQTKNANEKTTYFNRPSALYLPAEYSPGFVLEEFLGADVAAGLFVAPIYLEYAPPADQSAAADVAGAWREFFYRIGVNKIPTVIQTASGGVIEFYAGAELKSMLTSTNVAIVSAAFRLIDRNWRSYYGQFRTRRYASGSATAAASSFVTALRQTLAPTTKKGRVPINETFLNTDALHVVFGKSPAYLDVELLDEEFMDVLGVTHKIDAAACVRRLDHLRRADRVTAKELRTLYTALEERLAIEPSAVTGAMTSQSRLYAPNVKRWCTASEVVWESNSTFLDSLYPPLEHAYPEHRQFFCKHLGIAKRPSEDAMVSALKALPTFDALPEHRQREAYAIYRRLNAALREARESDPEAVPDWLARLRTEQVFLDHAGRLVTSDNDLYIDDEPRLADLFKQHRQISLVPIERAHLSAVRLLLDACRIPTLTDCVQYKRLLASDQKVDHALSKRFRARAQAIMRLFFHRHHRLFEDAVENGSWARLSQLEIVSVGELSVEATLADYAAPFSAEILRAGHIVYVRRDVRGQRDRLCTELCTMLGAQSDVADTIHRVVFADTDEEVEHLFESRGIEAIPLEELADFKKAEASVEPIVDAETGVAEEESSEESVAPTSNDVMPPAEAAHERMDADSGAADKVSAEQSVDATSNEGLFPAPIAEPASPTEPANSSHSGAGRSSAGQSSGGSHGGATPPQGAAGALRDEASTPTDSGRGVISGETEGDSTPVGAARRRDRPHSSGRLLSYAEPHIENDRDASEEEAEAAEQRRQTAMAAVNFVIGREREDGHQVEEMPFNNEGFDLQRTTADGSMEYIEVKGQSGIWTEMGIVLTPAELQYAQRFRERYFLYVVEFANDPERRTLYRIQDPFGKVMQFRFDSGWKAIAKTSDTIEPAVGLKIQLEEGIGTIVSVRHAGQLISLQVQIGEAAPKTVVFVPGKMRVLRA
jgi:hypothetical protein